MKLQSSKGELVNAHPIQWLFYVNRDKLKKPFKYDWNETEIVCYNGLDQVTRFPIRMEKNDWIVYDETTFKVIDVTVLNKEYFDRQDFTGKLF